MEKKYLKIVFICSSLEEGRDGVGDYTRRLAAAVTKIGHRCKILSLNDRYINDAAEEEQETDGTAIQVLRLSASSKISTRYMRARNWIADFDPEWISLQFVPFGYHPKGLKVGLSSLLSSLSKKARWHIMFHELWVGIAREESVKLNLWGRGQRVLIRSLVKSLQPKIVHTNTALYQLLLAKAGIRAGFLPLFSNIPVLEKPDRGKTDKRVSLVVFGAIHDKAPIEAFAREAALYQLRHNTSVSLTIIGRGNSEHERWASAFKNEALAVNITGEQSAEEISAIFSKATHGLSATALAVIEKSGSYAAMREHGLPVISVAKSWTPAGVEQIPVPNGIVPYHPGNFEHCITHEGAVVYNDNVFEVAAQFAEALSGVTTN